MLIIIVWPSLKVSTKNDTNTSEQPSLFRKHTKYALENVIYHLREARSLARWNERHSLTSRRIIIINSKIQQTLSFCSDKNEFDNGNCSKPNHCCDWEPTNWPLPVQWNSMEFNGHFCFEASNLHQPPTWFVATLRLLSGYFEAASRLLLGNRKLAASFATSWPICGRKETCTSSSSKEFSLPSKSANSIFLESHTQTHVQYFSCFLDIWK